MIMKDLCTYSCRLTCLFCLLSGVLGWSAFFAVGLADGVAGGVPLVFRALGPSGSGPAGFRVAGGSADGFAGAAESGADLAGGHDAAGRAGRVPAHPGQRAAAAGEVELGVAGDEQPGPAVGGGGVAQQWPGPAELLLQ